MSILKQSTGQAREAFEAMPMQSRVIAGMLVIAIAIGLAFLVRGNHSTGRENLFGGRSFGEQELDAIEMAFSSAGLQDWEREGRRIKIPTESKAAYLAALEESASLPISLRSRVNEAINATSVFDSSELRVAREMHAKEQDLGTKIMSFPDVRFASVEYDRGERRGLGRTRPQSASVLVIPEGTQPLSRARIASIERIVHFSYAGMSADEVSVIDTNSTSGSGFIEDEDPLSRAQHEHEARYEQKIRSLLYGYEGARVAVYAEIDPTMDAEKTIVKYDSEPTNLSNTSRKIETASSRQPNRGVPGTNPNAIGNRSASIEDTLETTTSKEDERITSGVAGQEYENSRQASLQVKKVRVSVGLPTSYYEKLYRQNAMKEDPNRSAADIPPMSDDVRVDLESQTTKEIRNAVTTVLPELSAGADTDPLVHVFKYPDLPSPPAPEAETAKIALTWLAESWQTIALVLLALAALLVARSAAKGTGDATPSEFREGFGLEIPAPPPEPVDEADGEDRMTITGGSLKDELLTVVEGNPEVAANVIRGWIADAA